MTATQIIVPIIPVVEPSFPMHSSREHDNKLPVNQITTGSKTRPHYASSRSVKTYKHSHLQSFFTAYQRVRM